LVLFTEAFSYRNAFTTHLQLRNTISRKQTPVSQNLFLNNRIVSVSRVNSNFETQGPHLQRDFKETNTRESL